MSESQTIPNRLLYSVAEARQLLGGWSNAFFYEQVKRGAVRITKISRRSFVHRDEIARVASGGGEAA